MHICVYIYIPKYGLYNITWMCVFRVGHLILDTWLVCFSLGKSVLRNIRIEQVFLWHQLRKDSHFILKSQIGVTMMVRIRSVVRDTHSNHQLLSAQKAVSLGLRAKTNWYRGTRRRVHMCWSWGHIVSLSGFSQCWIQSTYRGRLFAYCFFFFFLSWICDYSASPYLQALKE